MSSKILRGVTAPTDGKKTAYKHESQKENVQRKNAPSKVPKIVSGRYGQQVELKEQNQHLMSVNEELQKNLSDTQQKVADLELQFSELQNENVEIKKNLHNCHVLLVSAKIDPVLGEKVGDTARQNEDDRKEALSVSTNLLSELKAFGDVASQQRARLKEIQTTMENIRNAREQMKQEQENFSQQATEMEKALEEAEALLL